MVSPVAEATAVASSRVVSASTTTSGATAVISADNSSGSVRWYWVFITATRMAPSGDSGTGRRWGISRNASSTTTAVRRVLHPGRMSRTNTTTAIQAPAWMAIMTGWMNGMTGVSSHRMAMDVRIPRSITPSRSRWR